MLTKVQYTDSGDRQVKMLANTDKFLIEEQNITEGNFLIFSDVKPIDIQLADISNTQAQVVLALVIGGLM